MRVVLHTILARPDANGRPGEEISVSDKLGKQLIDGGYATASGESKPAPKPEPKIESAAIEQDEKAVMPPPKRRRATKK